MYLEHFVQIAKEVEMMIFLATAIGQYWLKSWSNCMKYFENYLWLGESVFVKISGKSNKEKMLAAFFGVFFFLLVVFSSNICQF